MVVLLTECKMPPFFKRRLKDRSKIERNPLNLCGIAAMGEILSWPGGLSFTESYSTILHWPAVIFLTASTAKWSSASSDSADQCGPCSNASQISSLVHGRPVLVGHRSCAHSFKSSPAGWDVAIPDGHISPCPFSGKGVEGGSTVSP
jgi:hypothetical protein